MSISIFSTKTNGRKVTEIAPSSNCYGFGLQLVGPAGTKVVVDSTNDPTRTDWYPLATLEVDSGQTFELGQRQIYTGFFRYTLVDGNDAPLIEVPVGVEFHMVGIGG